jgi:aminoglycoside phosphotransferase (APT) family kinase protein
MSSPFAGTRAATEPWLDLPALEALLRVRIPGFAGPLQAERFNGGQSNPTFQLITPERRYVMRCKPGPVAQLLPTAHAIEREARVLRALHGSAVPVPEVLLLHEDEALLGRAFYVMEMLDGEVHWDPRLKTQGNAQRTAIFEAMNATIAAIHSVDLDAAGLRDYGAPGNYYDRGLGRWTKQYRAAEFKERPIAAMEQLIEWLPANAPPPASVQTRLLHGDFRLDNLVFERSTARVLGVLDWELSTLGDPLADFAYHALAWVAPPGPMRGLAGVDLAALGIPALADYCARYEARSGFTVGGRWNFYFAYNLFRLAAIMQGVAARARQGIASSQEAVAQGALAPQVAELGWALAREGWT